MRRYFLKRLLLLPLTLLGITFIAYVITRFVPGGPLDQALAQKQQAAARGRGVVASGNSSSLSPAEEAQLKKFYKLDRPLLIGYGEWLGVWPNPDTGKYEGLMQGEFGHSFLRGQPVLEVIVEKLPVSAWLGGWSLVLTYGVCIPLGIVKALRHRTRVDNVTSVVLFTGYALPGYILAVVSLYFFAFHWEVFPHSGIATKELEGAGLWLRLKDRAWHSVLPLACLTSGNFALMTLLMKNSLLDNLALDYVRTAVAKGVSFHNAVLRHAFRNSLVPVATGFGNCLGALLAGSFLIEKIFDIDGIGLLSFSSLVGRDYPVFLGLLTCSSFLLLLGNIVSDVCVALVDPRIRFGK
ncbi:MAG: ABC transporter permease [Puniceicoccales bacterium]|jgi:microcin C transport system permease protein|nr:ABC transporter permease [Puniceicoccales bacterium]